MAENAPFSVRMETEDKEKLIHLIQDSGKSSKDFMSVLLSAYELNKVKVEIPEIAQDINHLEALTQQINNVYVNVGKRIKEIEKARYIQYNKDMESYKENMEKLKEEKEDIYKERNELNRTLKTLVNEKDELVKNNTQLKESLESSKALINEYKEKNTNLNEVLNEYKQLKDNFNLMEKELLQNKSTNIELETLLKENKLQITNLNQQLEYDDKLNKDEFEKFKFQEELKKEKALLEQEKSFSKITIGLKEDFNNKIDEYNDKTRSYQIQIEELMNTIYKLRSEHENTKGAERK